MLLSKCLSLKIFGCSIVRYQKKSWFEFHGKEICSDIKLNFYQFNIRDMLHAGIYNCNWGIN